MVSKNRTAAQAWFAPAKDGPDDGKRKRYGAEYKVKIAFEALRCELMVARLVTKHGMDQIMVSDWKRRAHNGLAALSYESDAEQGHQPGRRGEQAARKDQPGR